MRLSAGVLIITAALLQSTSAAAASNPWTYYTDGQAADNQPAATDGIPGFYSQNQINVGSAPFDKKTLLPTLVFREMTDANIATFVKYGAEFMEATIDPSKDLTREPYKKFLGNIGKEQIQACTNDHCLKWLYEDVFKPKLGGFLKGKDALNGVHINHLVKTALEGCTKSAGGTASTDPSCVKGQLDAIPEAVRKAYAEQIVKSASDKLQHLPESMLKSVFSVPSACKAISDPASLRAILTIGSSKNPMTPECFAAIPVTTITSITGADGKLDTLVTINAVAALYKNYNGNLPVSLSAGIKEAYLKEFASGFKHAGDMPGKGLDLAVIKDGLKGITQPVLLGNLNKASVAVDFGDSGKKLPATLFKDVSAEDSVTALGSLSGTAYKNMSGEAIAVNMNANPAICPHLPVDADYSKVKLTSELCFRALPSATQAKVLATAAEIPDDALIHVTGEQVKSWEYKPANSDGFSGANVLAAKKGTGRPNMDKIVAGFGVDPDGDDPCKVMPAITEMAATLADHITYECFKAGEHEFPTDPKEKINERLRYLMPFPQLKKSQPKEFFTKMTPKTMETLMKTGIFCKGIDQETWNTLSSEIKPVGDATSPVSAKSPVDAKCLAELMSHLTITKEDISLMSENVLVGLKAEQIPATMIPAFSTKQLLAADPSIATLFTADTLKAIDLAAVPDAFWTHVAPEAFKGLVAVKDVKPENMVHWTVTQIKEAPASAFAGLTKEQAQTVGSEAPGDASPVKYLSELEGILDDARQVLQSRLKDSSEASDGMPSWVWFVIGGVVAVVLIGGLVYFFVLRK